MRNIAAGGDRTSHRCGDQHADAWSRAADPAPDRSGAVDVSNQMATACAVGYPFGVIGVILCVVVLSVIFRKNRGPKDTHNNQTFINEFSVSNPAVFGKTIRDIMKDAHIRIVVSGFGNMAVKAAVR